MNFFATKLHVGGAIHPLSVPQIAIEALRDNVRIYEYGILADEDTIESYVRYSASLAVPLKFYADPGLLPYKNLITFAHDYGLRVGICGPDTTEACCCAVDGLHYSMSAPFPTADFEPVCVNQDSGSVARSYLPAHHHGPCVLKYGLSYRQPFWALFPSRSEAVDAATYAFLNPAQVPLFANIYPSFLAPSGTLFFLNGRAFAQVFIAQLGLRRNS
ncbi:hypothetical protein [Nitrospirillum amazonense]|uniref:hypothetical protein n=1 Tax=Nitrospirillum amazonense TaxID=28077 RepID=UPI002412AEAC|nr:hypothetical protein [Nitrospirillum amazonense]MDG3444673.1 hypothetical protein [Nitrospirillum amazonense]